MAEYSTPVTYTEAMESEAAPNWKKAIEEELEAHETNKTWSIVERKPSMRVIDSKWVFKILKDTNGNIYRYKARLCARGFMQREGIDYTDTYAPVVRYDSLRVLLAIIATENLEVAQFDVVTAFLNGDLEEEVFMEVPEGYKIKNLKKQSIEKNASVVCKLKRSLYGLK